MVVRRSSAYSCCRQGISGNFVFSGRIQRVVDGLLGEDVGLLRSNAQRARDGQTRRRHRNVGSERTRPFVVSIVQRANRLGSDNRFLGPDAETLSSAAPGSGDGPGAAARVQEDDGLRCQPKAAPPVPFAEILPGLESRRKGLESPETS